LGVCRNSSIDFVSTTKFAVTKNFNNASPDWVKVYSGDVYYNQMSVSTDGTHLFFLLNEDPISVYIMDASNGNVVKRYQFTGIGYSYEYSEIYAYSSGSFFIHSLESGNP
jgi:hypothetical protein